MSIFEEVMLEAEAAESRERDAIAEAALLKARQAEEFAKTAKEAVKCLEKLLEVERAGIVNRGGTSSIRHQIFSAHYTVVINFTFAQLSTDSRTPPEFSIMIRGGDLPGKYTMIGHGKLEMESNYAPSQLGKELTVEEKFDSEPIKNGLRTLFTEAFSYYKTRNKA